MKQFGAFKVSVTLVPLWELSVENMVEIILLSVTKKEKYLRNV